MMPLFWVMFWSILPLLLPFSDQERCPVHESSESPLLKSLQCYNDYATFVNCEWTEHRNTTLQLWFKKENGREQCMPFGTPAQHESERRIVQCRYNDTAFSIGINHTVFFLEDTKQTHCSYVSPRPLDLSKRLRARPPVNLSTHDAGNGGRLLRWHSPYPSSSSLNQNITYQLSYRRDGEDNWMTEDARNTSMKLEKQLLVLGHTYEARVRARVRVGQWSHWSTVVTWQMEDSVRPSPRLHCVLVGETEVMCSWEVSKELADFITYQLACGHNQTAPSERCCVNSTVNSDLGGAVLKYSCSLIVTNPEHLLLELVPTHNAKIFFTHQHIRPHPPEKVAVREKNGNWRVEWIKPSISSIVRLFYQVCYYSTQDEAWSVRNISEGSMSLTILQNSLVPSQDYQVKVRSLVIQRKDSMYRGIPSEWTDPVTWTSHGGSPSMSTVIYISISVFATTVFLTLYCTIPACKRRVTLWVDSIPSPGKSKILSEIKSATSQTLTQSEKTSVCKVQHLDTRSTCSLDASLCPNKSSENENAIEDEYCWNCDNSLSVSKQGNSSGMSSMSFSGPYIFCQEPEPICRSLDVKCNEEERKTLSDDSVSSPPVNFTLYGDSYVFLPNLSTSKSTQDLLSHTEPNTNTQRQEQAEQADQHHPDTTERPDKTDVMPGSWQPPAYTSGPVIGWPQGDAIHSSGYCQLPTVH
uniref:Fibronectin type-III domain-containing protein n=1 Tax=Mola mola TaxID=94237 RepID=A0A3Q3VL98_MOLML